MRILLLGGGGREHAFAWKMSQSNRCTKLFIAPGNPGTAAHGENVGIDPNDPEAVGEFCVENTIDLLVVGPEEPLVRGVRDHFESDRRLRRVLIVGPGKAGAVLEGSKAWSKAFMMRHQIPTAGYREFEKENLEEGIQYLRQHSLPIVLKADGLAAGKGVVICSEHEEAVQEFRAMLEGKFGEAGSKVVVEQFLTGIEYSVFILTDGQNYVLLPEAKDYKRIGEGDTGPNTGGMGAVSPVPFVTPDVWEKTINTIIEPTVAGLQTEKIPYKGFIFFGLILVDGEPMVIEYNARMGDPETEAVLPRIKSDLVPLLKACAQGKLAGKTLRVDSGFAATTFLVSKGYPGDYPKGKVIQGLASVDASCLPFHAGTKTDSKGQLITSGGRVMAITAKGRSLESATRRSRRNARLIEFEGKNYRKDIGKDLF